MSLSRSSTTIGLGSLLGAMCLVLFSMMQKVIIGVDPLQLKGYLVPVVFGAASGALVGWYLHRCRQLAARLAERLEDLERYLPMCSRCKRVRVHGGDMADPASWQPVDEYLTKHSGVEVTHGLCPDCACELYGHECQHRRVI